MARLQRVPGKAPVRGLRREDLDLADEDRVLTTFAASRPRAVVHLAASLMRANDEASVAVQWRDTFWAGKNVVHAAVRAGARHLILAGTMEELGDQDGEVGPEVVGEPWTTYGLCKALVREVACFAARHTPIRVDWFRPTTVYGPGQQGTMLVPYACASARRGRKAQFTNGSQRRDFLFIEDLLDWLVLALREEVGEAAERGVHIHHLGTGTAVAVRDVLDTIAQELPGADFELDAVPMGTHEPMVQVVPPYEDSNPTLGTWKPSTTWEQGIRQTAAWWRSQAP